MEPVGAAATRPPPQMFIRIAVTTTMVAAALFAVKEQGLLAQAGLTASCTSVQAPAADRRSSWQACTAGLLEGHPDLTRQQCTAVGTRNELQLWRCPVELVGAPR